jgi:hypothetical protein
MAWDESNNFARDTLNESSDRASLMQKNIAVKGLEYGVPDQLITWGSTCSTVLREALATANVEKGEKDVAYELYQFKVDETHKLSVNIKAATIACVKNSENELELLDEYGATGTTPRSRMGLQAFVDQYKMTYDRLVAAGDLRVLPESVVTKLVTACDDMIKLWHDAQVERQESAEAYDILHALQKEYAQKFRAIYTIVVIMAGKYSPDLLLLGFAPATPPAGHGQPGTPTGLMVQGTAESTTVSCDETDSATSYQFKYSSDGEDWFELYSGEQYTYTYNPPAGNRSYKVRARNKNGFSGWSNVVEFDPPEVPL